MTSQVNLLHNRQASSESDANELVKASYLLQSESKDIVREQNVDIKTGVRTVIRQNGRCLRDRSVNQLHGYQPGSGIVRGRKKVLISPSQHRGKSWCKAVSGLDLSRSLTCTPSYRLLPMKYIRTSSHLHPLRAEVLNDHWVCVPSSSQDYCLKRSEMSDFEEKMQQCEDDRCEVDVLLECTRAAIRRMEDLMIRLQSSKEVHVDDYLTVTDWRCCERLHVEHGIECEQMIRKDPKSALPVVIGKLKQKQDELVIVCEGLDNCWKEVYQNKKEKPSEKGNRRASAVQSRQGKSLTRRKKR